ncbi:MAG: ATP-binding protein [Lachnospiraceae bacterium]|nr:ATP-binding protein [Lachnospiraceae bacterium]
MNRCSVRIESVVLDDFKNVKHGEINLENKKSAYRASVLGLYGQNGSGKTALIDSIGILKLALSGSRIPAKYADYINIGADSASLKFQFLVKKGEAQYHAWYEFRIRRELRQEDYSPQNIENSLNPMSKYRVTLYDECLRFQYCDKKVKIRMASLIDTKTEEVFLPKSRYIELVGTDKKTSTDIYVAYKLAEESSRSFIFSRQLVNTVRKNCSNVIYKDLINSLLTFGTRELFVINTDTSGLISLNALPIAFKYKYDDESKETFGQLAIPLNESVLVPMELVDVVRELMSNMNIVLEQIIPGLSIKVYELDTELSKDSKPGKRLQLMSERNGKEIPLKYESEGIKKIVSILQLLIVVYNSESITLAVDELDAGIFEYLLGELLKVISEKGKGQLIFTSHNLRPLETIDKGFIAFTTVNPENRYIRFVNVKGNNNLRDFYYRDITLGEQTEPVYDPTNNYEIMLALKEAGKTYDTKENTSCNS